MAVGADDLALRELRSGQASAAAPNEVSNIAAFHRSRQVIESHRRRMEATSAVGARLWLHLAHPRDQKVDTRALLSEPQRTPAGVIRSVVTLATRLAPRLVASPPAVELGEWLQSAARGAPPKIRASVLPDHPV